MDRTVTVQRPNMHRIPRDRYDEVVMLGPPDIPSADAGETPMIAVAPPAPPRHLRGLGMRVSFNKDDRGPDAAVQDRSDLAGGPRSAQPGPS